jgi:tetratricopeptide (TPR) repeat protein
VKAESAFRRALAIQQQLADSTPGEARYRQDLAETHNWYGELLRTTRRADEALRSYEAALALQARLAEERPGEADYRHGLARSHYNRGLLRDKQGIGDLASEDYLRAIALLDGVVKEKGDDPLPHLDLARAQGNLAALLRDQGKYEDSRVAYGEAVERLKRLAARFPNRHEYRFELAKNHRNLGNLEERNLRDLDRAGASLEAARKFLVRLTEDFHTRPAYREEEARTYNSLGALHYQRKTPEARALAEENWRTAAEIAEGLAERPENVEPHYIAGQARNNLGFFHLKYRKMPADARPHLEAALRHFDTVVNREPARVDARRDRDVTLRYLAEVNQEPK